MKIYEHQGRDLLASAGIPVPPGRIITAAGQALETFTDVTRGMASPLAVVKAQVHAGGRGKAGFVKLVRSATEAQAAAQFMLTHRMVSPQTPPEGLQVTKVLIAQAADIAVRPAAGSSPAGSEEFYLAITTDRATRRNILIASRFGGVDIEQVAHDHPQAILREPLDPVAPGGEALRGHQARRVAFALGFKGKQVNQAADIMQRLAKVFIARDCTLAEINPLVITPPGPGAPDGRVLAIDAKFAFDENAAFRHPDIRAMAEEGAAEETGPSAHAEERARKFGLSYIALDGTIGCLVNGAGLAMATMDIIKLHGAEPANFLDVGGSASEEAVTEAFSIILADRKVKGVMVNIFGGIMKCDIIAQGIVNAAKRHRNADGSTGFRVPLVVRLEGTNVQAGRDLLAAARADIPTMQPATDLTDAAKKVVAAVG